MVRGRERHLDTAHKVEANLSASIHNRFDLEVVDARTGEVRLRAQAENVICEQLWDRLLTPDSYFNYIHYGTGTGTPSASDTRLFSFLGYLSLSDVVSNVSYAQRWYSMRRGAQIAENIAVGETLTEIGIAFGNSASNLCTHAMLQDMNGNQISITKSDTDIINIYATVFVHWPVSLDAAGVQLIPYYYVNEGFLPFLAGLYDDSYGYGRACPPKYACLSTSRNMIYRSNNTNVFAGVYQPTVRTFDKNARTISVTANRFPVNYGNWANGARGIIMCLASQSRAAFYLKAGDGWYSGSIIKGEAIGTGDGSKVDFATAFDDPENATVYINGVASADVQVQKVPLAYNKMGIYFDCVVVENGQAYPYIKGSGYGAEGYDQLVDGVYYNPNWEIGIKSFITRDIQYVCVSDNLNNWDYIVGTEDSTSYLTTTVTIPEGLRKKKYWKVNSNNVSIGNYISNLTADSLDGTNIHFDTPPAAGAVITADYTTKCIAKDENHVFDLSVVIHLGEYHA